MIAVRLRIRCRGCGGGGSPSTQAGGFPGAPSLAEDCLFLNIWTPAADGGKRPVMFYSHGGGFTVGSGNSPLQNGANLARLYDVVVVESNHRLEALGYLYLGGLLGPEYTGNQGLLGVVAALAWVNENIAGFGGDPHNVMIFGESGGGGKTTCLYGMPLADPYFHKASIESPIGPGDRTPDQATAIARDAMRALGLRMTMIARTAPEADPAIAFTTTEIAILDRLIGDSGNRRAKPGTLQLYLTKLSRLGGYLARTSDPPPGNTVVWRLTASRGYPARHRARNLWVIASPAGRLQKVVCLETRSSRRSYQRLRPWPDATIGRIRRKGVVSTHTVRSQPPDRYRGRANSSLFMTGMKIPHSKNR